MSSWIKIEHITPDKPELVKMAAKLKIDQDAVLGKLIRVWIWADANTILGAAVPATDAFLDRITHCRGFAAAMRAVGWLTGNSGEVEFPAFDRHNGKGAKVRAETAYRVAKSRAVRNSTVTDVTQEVLQEPLPDKSREELLPSPSAGGREAEQIQTILRTYLLPANLDTLPALIQAKAQASSNPSGYLADCLAGTLAVAHNIATYAPQGWDSPFIPSAKAFFEAEQWRSPGQFRHRWSKPNSNPTAAAIRDRLGVENKADWGGEEFK